MKKQELFKIYEKYKSRQIQTIKEARKVEIKLIEVLNKLYKYNENYKVTSIKFEPMFYDYYVQFLKGFYSRYSSYAGCDYRKPHYSYIMNYIDKKGVVDMECFEGCHKQGISLDTIYDFNKKTVYGKLCNRMMNLHNTLERRRNKMLKLINNNLLDCYGGADVDSSFNEAYLGYFKENGYVKYHIASHMLISPKKMLNNHIVEVNIYKYSHEYIALTYGEVIERCTKRNKNFKRIY